MPTISVLMPVYNGAQFLREAIDSILGQTFTDFELVVCNDASTDSSKQIINSFQDDRIIYIENSENKGIVYTRNRLFEAARGEYFAIMDCDDVALPRKLEKQIAYMERNKLCGLCGTWSHIINPEGKVCGHIQMPVSHGEIQSNLLFQSSFVQSSVVIRKAALKNLRYNPDFPVAEDYELWSRLAQTTYMYNIPHYLLLYRQHCSNISLQKEQLIIERRNTIISQEFYLLFDKQPTGDELYIIDCIGSAKKSNRYQKQFWLNSQAYLRELVKINKEKRKIQPIADFVAVIWYRWFFFCFVNKRYFRGLSPTFFSCNPLIIFKVVKLIMRKLPSALFPKQPPRYIPPELK